MSRRLLITRRRIPLDRLEEYDASWHRLRAAAHAVQARTWRFRASGHDDLFLEFLEWDDTAPQIPERDAGVTEVRTALEHNFGTDHPDTWEEVPDPESPGDDRLALAHLLRERSLRRGDFVLSSGHRSNYYIDARVTTMSGSGQRLIGRVALRALMHRGWIPRAVGGLTLGADPVAFAIAHTASMRGMDVDAFSVRKEAKTHGTGRRIEGAFDERGSVVIVEDVITTGESALEAIAVVRQSAAHILGVLALVDRMEGGVERLRAAGLEVLTIFTVKELLGEDGDSTVAS